MSQAQRKHYLYAVVNFDGGKSIVRENLVNIYRLILRSSFPKNLISICSMFMGVNCQTIIAELVAVLEPSRSSSADKYQWRRKHYRIGGAQAMAGAPSSSKT